MNEPQNLNPPMQTNEIVLRLTFGEVDAVITALSERPFKDVFVLIGKIHSQSNSQLSIVAKQVS